MLDNLVVETVLRFLDSDGKDHDSSFLLFVALKTLMLSLDDNSPLQVKQAVSRIERASKALLN